MVIDNRWKDKFINQNIDRGNVRNVHANFLGANVKNNNIKIYIYTKYKQLNYFSKKKNWTIISFVYFIYKRWTMNQSIFGYCEYLKVSGSVKLSSIENHWHEYLIIPPSQGVPEIRFQNSCFNTMHITALIFYFLFTSFREIWGNGVAINYLRREM